MYSWCPHHVGPQLEDPHKAATARALSAAVAVAPEVVVAAAVAAAAEVHLTALVEEHVEAAIVEAEAT
jgi:hypothetical protein